MGRRLRPREFYIYNEKELRNAANFYELWMQCGTSFFNYMEMYKTIQSVAKKQKDWAKETPADFDYFMSIQFNRDTRAFKAALQTLLFVNAYTLMIKKWKSVQPKNRTQEAAKNLADRAMGYTRENPLYVVAIAAITNVASAILLRPEITERMVLVWLGGNALDWPNNREYNLYQDIAAARVIFESRVPLVQLPCMGVVSSFTVSGPELKAHLKGKNPLCDYLADFTEQEALACGGGRTWSRPIWDVAAVVAAGRRSDERPDRICAAPGV